MQTEMSTEAREDQAIDSTAVDFSFLSVRAPPCVRTESKTLVCSENRDPTLASKMQVDSDVEVKDGWVFDPAAVTRFFNMPRVTPSPSSTTIVKTVILHDNGSNLSRPSNFVILSVSHPGNVILGVDSFEPADNAAIESRLMSHLTALQTMECCDAARFEAEVEGGTGLTADHIARFINNSFEDVNVHTVRHSNVLKLEMVTATRAALASGQLSIHANAFTACDSPALLWDNLRLQLLLFSKTIMKGRIVFSGRDIDKKADDSLAVALQLAIKCIQDLSGNDV